MFRPLLLAVASLAALLPYVEANGAGSGSNIPTAPDGPNKLDECPCDRIYKKMIECQKLKGPNSGIRDCICIPNPDGWYPYMDRCRTCLQDGNEAGIDSFFDQMAGTVTQLFVSCTERGGGVVSNGISICASNSAFRACTALRDGKSKDPSWASFEDFRDGSKTNATYTLNIKVPEAASNSGAASTATTVSASATGKGSSSTTAASPGSSGTSNSTTPSSGVRTFSGPSGDRQIVGVVLAVGLGALLV